MFINILCEFSARIDIINTRTDQSVLVKVELMKKEVTENCYPSKVLDAPLP